MSISLLPTLHTLPRIKNFNRSPSQSPICSQFNSEKNSTYPLSRDKKKKKENKKPIRHQESARKYPHADRQSALQFPVWYFRIDPLATPFLRAGGSPPKVTLRILSPLSNSPACHHPTKTDSRVSDVAATKRGKHRANRTRISHEAIATAEQGQGIKGRLPNGY